MNFEEYQASAHSTAIYPDIALAPIYPTLGLAGEAGEVADKVKKLIRDKDGIPDDEWIEKMKLELGDVLWYVAEICTSLHITMEEVASKNVDKLFSRRDRNVIKGEGDNR